MVSLAHTGGMAAWITNLTDIGVTPEDDQDLVLEEHDEIDFRIGIHTGPRDHLVSPR